MNGTPWWNDHFRRNRLLSRRSRVIRPLAPPVDFERGDFEWRPLPGRMPPGHLAFRRAERWRRLWSYRDEGLNDFVRVREHVAIVTTEDDQTVAGVLLTEIDASAFVDQDTFFEALDDEDGYLGRIAYVLCANWEPDEAPTMYGPIIDITTIWTHRLHRPLGLWRSALDALVSAVSKRHSIMIALPFPLEYEGLLEPGAAAQIGHDRRTRALRRVAGRELGMTALESHEGDDAWYWRASPRLGPVLTEPEYDPDWMPQWIRDLGSKD